MRTLPKLSVFSIVSGFLFINVVASPLHLYDIYGPTFNGGSTYCLPGKSSTLIYRPLANCKSDYLNPEYYLAEVIKGLPANAPLEQAAELTPAKFAPSLASESASAAGA